MDKAHGASVARFQDQQGPIVIVSRCTSPGEAGPRGQGFVLTRNRHFAALSPARSLAELQRKILLCWLLDAERAN